MNDLAAPAAVETSLQSPAIQSIGVIGAGQMGNGISHVCALAGMPVVLLDVPRPDALDEGDGDDGAATWTVRSSRGTITQADAKRRGAGAGHHDAPTTRRSKRLRHGGGGGDREGGGEAGDLPCADRLTCKPSCMIASEHLLDFDHAAWRQRPTAPGKFIGMHFMNPVPVMKLVEVIRGIATDDADLPGDRAGAGRHG